MVLQILSVRTKNITKNDTEDENKTYQKISGIDLFYLPTNQERYSDCKNKTAKLEQDLEKVNATLKELLVKKITIKEKLEKATSSQETLNVVATIFS